MARSASDHVHTEDAIALLQGGLGPARAEHVLAHVDHCAACNELVIAMARMPTIRGEVPTRPDRAADDDARTLPPGLDTTDPLMTRVAGRYQLRRILGAGGMGVVYEAHDHELDRRVALKLVRHDHGSEPELAARRLVEEARAMARLHHPAVITVYDAGTTEGQAFIAMELIDGGTLRTWLAGRRRSWREIVRVFVQAAHGLAAAHAAGMVHGDVKPDNVLVDRLGRAHVADLGLARAAGGAGESFVGGTLAYMAPEQLDGVAATAASDQFAFGIALHEALTGHRPGADATLPRTARAMPIRVARLVRHMLEHDPAARFPSMTAAAIALGRSLRRRWPWLVAAGAAAGLIGVGLVIGFGGLGRAASPCDRAPAGVEAWTPATAGRLRDGFAASGVADAADRAGAVTTTLDAYHHRLRDERAVACAADVPAERARLELACLDRRRRGFATAVEALVDRPSPAIVAHAIGIVADLPPADVCREDAFLIGPPPAERRAEIEAIERELDRGRVLRAAGQLDDARRITLAAAERAVRIVWAPVETAAWLALARLLELTHDIAGSEVALNRAIAAAARSRDDRGAAIGLTELFEGVMDQGRFAEAERLAPLAEAAVVRAGDPPDLRAGLHQTLGWLEAQRSNQWEEARQHWMRARELLESSRGVTSEQVGVVTIDLALAELQLDRPEAALAELARAETILRDRLSLAELANYHTYKCRAHDMLGDVDRAAAECKAALVSIRDGLGPDHPMATSAEDSLAVVLEHQGKLAEALPHYQRALAVQERAEGAAHFVSLEVRTNLADALLRAGRLADAEALIEEGLRIAEAAYGKDHGQVAYLLLSRAELRRAQARPADAIADLERALPLLERGGDDAESVADVRAVLDELRAAPAPAPAPRTPR